MIVDKASGFSSGFSSGFGNHWHTYLGPTATARILYGDLTSKTLSAPVFSGTIPTIAGNEGDSNIITDLSTYFTGATSYSIAPAVETGWNFDTVTGILTVDTDEANTFGTYVVTGTNTAGSQASNAFSVIISAVTTSTTKGGYVPATLVHTKLKKKDREILELVYELVAKTEEVPELPKEIIERVQKVEVKAKKAINIESISQHEKQISQTRKQIHNIEQALNRHIKALQEDEDAAISALLSII